MTTGQRIKAARKAAGLTQAELANKLDIPYQSIGQWERDLRNPKRETLRRIAAALGVSEFDLSDDPTRHKILGETLQAAEDLGAEVLSDLEAIKARESQPNRARLNAAYYTLNDKGQQKAAEIVEIIAGNPDYQQQKQPPQPE